MTGWLLIAAAFAFWAFVSWCLCRVAGRADEHIERIFSQAPHRADAGDDDCGPLSLSSASVLVDLESARRARRTT